MQTEQTPILEETAQKAVETIKQGRFREFFQYVWDNYQNDLIRFGKILVLSLAVILVAKICIRMTHALFARSAQKIHVLDEAGRKVLDKIASYVIAFLAFLIVLDLFGVNTASLITVLGAAGLAIGLALKETLGNIAAGIILLFMRPFSIGDYVDCSSVSGTVREIGLFTTTLCTADGLYVSVPNGAILGQPFGISYSDPLDRGIAILKELVMNDEMVLKTPVPEVMVQDLADNSVVLQVRVWASVEHYWEVYWRLKYQLKEALESKGLSIPFPQRVITLANALPGGKEDMTGSPFPPDGSRQKEACKKQQSKD